MESEASLNSCPNEKILKGIPSTVGYSIGKAFVIPPAIPAINLNSNDNEVNVDYEIERFTNAVQEYSNELKRYSENIKSISQQVDSIIESLLLLVQDQVLIESVINEIRRGKPVEKAIDIVFNSYLQALASVKNKLFVEKAVELEQLRNHLLEIINNKKFFSNLPPDSIIVAQSVSPEQVIVFKNLSVKGIITEIGGLTTHASILCRSIGITNVIGVQNATKEIATGDLVAIDGYKGLIVVNPSTKTQENLHIQIQQERELKDKLGDLLTQETKTKDGKRIQLQVNINFVEELDQQVIHYSDGIGLVRTEHLVKFPKDFSRKELEKFEKHQMELYSYVAQKLYPKTVIFRIFDIGGDKFYSLLKISEKNPMLGFRGIRFLLDNPEILKSQIRALLAASVHKNVKIMIPMITTIQEIKDTIFIINDCQIDFLTNGREFDKDIQIGAMIETPAAALQADVIAKYVDFLSIGTNDLTQYTVVADRENQLVANYFDPFHPSVLKLMQMTAEGAHYHNKPVGICGELAAHSAATELLIGLGLDSISVSPANFLQVKKWISEIDSVKAEEVTHQILQLETYDDIRKRLVLI